MSRLLTLGLAGLLIVGAGCSSEPTSSTDASADAAHRDTTPLPDEGDTSVADTTDSTTEDVTDDATPDDTTDAGDVDPGDSGQSDAGPSPDSDAGCTSDLDSDSDGLPDCRERNLCTDPNDGDTDGDGLGDFEEIRRGTDPCDGDTDDDGLNDRREVHFGLDPNRQSTYEVPQRKDSNRWFVDHCKPGNPGATPASVNFYTDRPGNWMLALPPNFDYSPVTIADFQRPEAAAVYDQASLEISGALLARDMPDSQSSPTDPLETGVGSIDQTIRGMVAETIDNAAGGAFTTHNRKQAAINSYEVRLAEKISPRAFRDQLLKALSPHQVTDGLPPSAGNPYDEYRLQVSVVQRLHLSGARTNLISFAVAPLDKYDRRDLVEFRLDGLTDTTNVADASAETKTPCVLQKAPQQEPRANFYWVLDQSGSMDEKNSRIEDFSGPFNDIANDMMFDYELGLSNMSNNNGRLTHRSGGPGWHTDSSDFTTAIDKFVIDCHDQAPSTWQCVGEYGIEMAARGLQFMESSLVEPEEELRSDTSVFTIFMSDEAAQGAWQTYRDQLIAETTTYALTLHEETVGCRARFDPRPKGRYRDVARESGGKFADLCTADLEQFLEDMIYSANLDTSPFGLVQTPISHSLRVYLDDQWVPRSTDDGFDYSATANKIGFFGPTQPTFGVPSGTQPDWVGISFWAFRDRCKDTRNRSGVNTCKRPDDED